MRPKGEMPGGQSGHFPLWVWLTCIAMTLLVAAVPFMRAFYRVEIDYNEGWNIYNATTVAAHGWLYPVRYGWTSVNYPMLSFAIMASLHRVTHEYLFTARMVSLASLLACSLLVGAIVRNLAQVRAYSAACLAGLFTVALFCANANFYVGMDDPQMLAQVFFLGGLYVYVAWRNSLASLALTALLFAIGGFIKHNPVDFPLAVLVELLLFSRSRAAWFSACGLLLAAVGVALNIHSGGPHFIDQLLAPRSWSAVKGFQQLRDGLGPVFLPVALAFYTAWTFRLDRNKRVTTILLALSILLGGYFGGGNGVSVNSLFSAFLAVAILIGLFLAQAQTNIARWVVPTIFLWLLIPLRLVGNQHVLRKMREMKAAEARFDIEVAAMGASRGPALCESLLRCYVAGKPYVYDPFNATRLVTMGKLDQTAFVRSIEEGRYGVIQLGVPLEDAARIEAVDSALRERFTPEMLEAIRRSYVLKSEDADTALYVPALRSQEKYR